MLAVSPVSWNVRPVSLASTVVNVDEPCGARWTWYDVAPDTAVQLTSAVVDDELVTFGAAGDAGALLPACVVTSVLGDGALFPDPFVAMIS